jgi:NitT/TauT family transport system ATP-binding protein
MHTAPQNIPNETLISCRDVELVFPGPMTALADVSFQLQRGELVSIVGPSGCGKSTLLRLIAGLLTPTSGQLELTNVRQTGELDEGKTHTRAAYATGRPDVGFVFQDATLLPWRTVQDNIRLPLELLHVPRVEHAARIQTALELVGLNDFALSFPAQLSGGMRMRIALVRALVTQPQLLLLDEPFGALDEITRQRLNEDLLELWQRQRWSAVFITHNVFEAVFLSQRVLVMSPRPGKIVAEFTIPFEYPRSPDIRGNADFARLAAEISLCLRKAAT